VWTCRSWDSAWSAVGAEETTGMMPVVDD